MARSAESGAYLGGISTMLAQVDVCPSCGRIHPDSRLGSLLPKSHECPLVVFGSMPTLTDPQSESISLRPISVEVVGGSTEPMMPPLPQPGGHSQRKPTGLSIPWPMPSHLEDYL